MLREMKLLIPIICVCLFSLVGSEKSSLTFAIDDTGSMWDDIKAVQKSVNDIFDTVMNSNLSQIDEFILVTFNDPGIQHRITTRDKYAFKSAVSGINVDGGDDCPEMAMSGIELALQYSKPGSLLYAFTDASAKDPTKHASVKQLALKKQIQVTFVLTGTCQLGLGNSEVYNQVAAETNGEVFHLDKSEVIKILDYVKSQINNKKEIVAAEKFPKGTHTLSYEVDSKMNEIIVSVSGEDAKVIITDPDGEKALTEDIVRLKNVVIVKVVEVKPGVYKAIVTSSSEKSVKVTAETNVHFDYGFSPYKPFQIEDTATRPIPDEPSYLSIKLTTDGTDDVVLDSFQLLDVNNKAFLEKRLVLVNKKDKFYVPETTLIPPNTRFRVAIKCHELMSKRTITRIGLTPVEPQSRETFVPNKKPTVEIVGLSKINAEYNEPLILSCKVSGYPKPKVVWQSSDRVQQESTLSLVELPFDYISTMTIERVKSNRSYICDARNDLGGESKTVRVETIWRPYFNVLNRPHDATIKIYKEASFECNVDAEPTAIINWYKNGRKLKENENVRITSNEYGAKLYIKSMHSKDAGDYICTARNDITGRRFDFTVGISGVELPLIDKSRGSVIRVDEGTNVEIPCTVIRGEPKPNISWYYKDNKGVENKVKDSDNEVLMYFPEVPRDYSGTFRCEATNEGGSDYHNLNLIVNYPPNIEGEDITELIAKVGDRVSIPCVVEGEPNPNVTWFLNDTKLSLSTRYRRDYKGHGIHFDANQEDTGSYTCQAINGLGIANKTVHLRVVRKATIAPPIESTLNRNVGDHVQLACDTDGYPAPKVTWIFYSPDPKKAPQILRATDVNHQLQLGRIQLKDEGFYTCTAKNIGGSSNITYEVIVNAPPNIENVYPEKLFTAVVGDKTLRIPCKATGRPKPVITWEIVGVGKIAAGTDWYDFDEDGTLVIKNIDKSVTGAYKCEARNSMGRDVETYEVFVETYPKLGHPSTTVSLAEGNSTILTCNIPHQSTDSIRWFKDGREISLSREYRIINARASDAGIYTCRVSDFSKSRSGFVKVDVGSKPRFRDEKEDLAIEFMEGESAVMDCSSIGHPTPKVSWRHEEKNLSVSTDVHIIVMNLKEMGNYTCLVENSFGNIYRTYTIGSMDCLLKIQSDLKQNQPLILNHKLTWPRFETSNGYTKIPSGEYIRLSCPKGFKNIRKTDVIAMCKRDTSFIVDGSIFKFSELQCQVEVMSTERMTGKKCLRSNPYSETVEIGYDLGVKFLSVYEVCLDTNERVPLYTRHGIDFTLANIDPELARWHKQELVPYEINELYSCDLQTSTVSSILSSWFHRDDSMCCFSKRQLVNARDVTPGLPQMATYSALNLVPHWSTCNSRNWENIESRVRELAKSTNVILDVWTGTAQQLVIAGHDIHIADRSSRTQPVPKYLWKVIQDPSTKASLAIVQLNIPDLKDGDAYRHVLCRDICHEIPWMGSGKHWRDVSKGYTFCCRIKDFERAFHYEDLFNSGSGKILHDVSLVPGHSFR